MQDQLPVISLFSGAGGLDLAVERCAEPPLVQDGASGPFKVAVATDYAPDTVKTLARNFPGTATTFGDIREISASDLLDAGHLAPGEPALLIGGPPCTPFSKSGFWIAEKRESRDPNASLLDEYVRMVAETKPAAFILENVQGLTYKIHQAQLARLLEQLTALGYNPQWKVLLAADYGVPQLRKRVFVIGARDGRKLHHPPATHFGMSERVVSQSKSGLRPHVTAAEAFRTLPLGEPEAGELVDGTFGALAAEVPPGQNYLWHTERGGGRNEFEWRSRYWTFLLRLSPDKPSTTIQAQPGPWVGPFYWENLRNSEGEMRARRLRVPEIKRLMTFPDTFQVEGDAASVQRQLGNAVPVELGKAVVRSVATQMGFIKSEDLDGAEGLQLEFDFS